jgi:hypothetical protein
MYGISIEPWLSIKYLNNFFGIFEYVLYKLYFYVLLYIILVCLVFHFISYTLAEACLHNVEDHPERGPFSVVHLS